MSANPLILPTMTKLLIVPFALAVALLAGSTAPSAAVPAKVVPAPEECLKQPARVSRALRPVGTVHVRRGMHARRPVCGGGFQVVSIVGPYDGRCLWTFYDPYSSPRVWSNWDYCP
jgi:hypothetical protein